MSDATFLVRIRLTESRFRGQQTNARFPLAQRRNRPTPMFGRGVRSKFLPSLILDQKLSVAEVSRSLGISESLIHTWNWKKAFHHRRDDVFSGHRRLTGVIPG